MKAVDKLLNEIGPKFTKVSAEIFTKSEQIPFTHSDIQGIDCKVLKIYALVDEMAQRLDDMEAAIKAGNDTGSEGN